jgi:hypothetical protein
MNSHVKTFFPVILSIIGLSFAQGQSQEDTLAVQLSSSPGAQEVVAILLPVAKGEHDPFAVLPRVIELGDSVVPALASILSGYVPSATGGALTISTDEMKRIRAYAIASLEAIGTQSAFTVLFGIASSTGDVDHRGAALRAIGIAFHMNAYLDSNTPDSEIIHLLVLNVDDTTFVAGYQKTIGQIAREGLIEWMNWDPGEPQLNFPQAASMRELWWQSLKDQISWDLDSRLFKHV